jgi:hypothetical protein
MSTIAYDGKQVVADRCASCHGGSFHEVTKVHLISHKGEWAIFASAGDMQDGILAREWLDGDQKDPKPKLNADSFVAIMVTKKKAYRMEEALVMWEIMAPHALGSGRDFARACMHLGMDAKRAVEVATELDIHTGCGMDSISVDRLI